MSNSLIQPSPRALDRSRRVTRRERDDAMTKLLAWLETDKPRNFRFSDVLYVLGYDHALAKIALGDLQSNGYVWRSERRVFTPLIQRRSRP